MSLKINPVASDSTTTQGPKKRVNTNNQEMPFNYGLKDVAPPNKGLVEIVTGKELPKMGLANVAPPNKGLLQVIIDWFK